MMKGMIRMLDNLELPNETIDKMYDDALHPVTSEAGKTAGLLARSINAALAPLEIWILKREYNVKQVKAELGKSLSTINPEKIVSPEPYVAVPALQAISYCMSNEELCDLYAKLLAKSMVTDTKDKVHPAFIEIIKQLSPNDALVFKVCSTRNAIPAVNLSIVMKQKGLHIVGSAPVQKFALDLVADISISSISEEQIRVSLDNLMRIGLIKLNDFGLEDGSSYSFVKSSEIYSEISKEFERLNSEEHTADHIQTDRKCLSITTLGKQFRSICIDGF